MQRSPVADRDEVLAVLLARAYELAATRLQGIKKPATSAREVTIAEQ